MVDMERWALGVFTSVDGGLGAGLDAVKQLGVPTVQLHAPTAEYRARAQSAEIRDQFAAAGLTITVVFVGFPEDDYASIERVQQTVGLVPRATRRARLAETLAVADFAAELGVDAIGMHLGFVPPDRTDAEYSGVVEATRAVCDHCQQNGQYFHLETGQETAAELLTFIQQVDRDNLKVNFDPANMILYRVGDPLEALDHIGQHVRSVHCKDAAWERRPGQPWHEDAPLGTGDVDIETFMRKLDALGYYGPLTIEREYSPDQAGDIAAALQLLADLRQRILGQP